MCIRFIKIPIHYFYKKFISTILEMSSPTRALNEPKIVSNYDYDIETCQNTNRKRIVQIFVDLICIAITYTALIIVYYYVKPRIQGFYCNQTDIFNPFIPSTIPFWMVQVYGVVGPCVTIILVELRNMRVLYRKKAVKKTFLIATIHAILIFVLGLGITVLLTDIGKRWVGSLRPHFIEICKPNFARINCTTIVNQFGNSMVFNFVATDGDFCTAPKERVDKARLSFPSGHSSFACYTMLFLIIYLEARLHLLRFRFVKTLIQMTAFITAFVTCVSRISDYHHHGVDVLGGATLGCVLAVFMTFVVGRVLWSYGHQHKKRYHDYDLRPLE
jgi:phosphatidate phosphatase